MSIIYRLSQHKKIRSKYKTGKCFSPAHDQLDPKLKSEPEYCRKVAEGAFYALMQNKHYFPIDNYGYMSVLRNYLTGNQDKSYYINLLKTTEPSPTSDVSSSNGREFFLKGYDHLDTQIVSSMPNIRSAIHGMLDEYDENIFANTIDDQSGQEELERMNEAFIDSKLQDYAKSVQSQYNIPLERPVRFPKNVTLEEMDIYREMGGFKAKWAEGVEQLGFYTHNKSNWNRTIKRKFIDDILCFNFISGRTIFDSENNEVKHEYMDPSNMTIQYSVDNDFNDAEYAGYFTLEKISRLIQKGFNLNELKKAAITYQGYFNNPTFTNYTNSPFRIDGDKIIDFRIPVFHYYWIDTDVKRILKIRNKFGERNISIDYDEDIKPLSDYKVKRGVSQKENEYRTRRAYQCSWIVDTDLVYDYGLVPNQYKENKKEPKIPVSAYRMISTNNEEVFGSMVEKSIPFLNRQQILWLKYQDALAKAHPGGYMINMRLLEHMEIGGKAISPLEAFDMFWRYGRGVYMDTPVGEPYKGGAVLPISRIDGNYGELLSILANEMGFIKNEIRENTGIDPASLGAISDAKSATEVSLANRGTGNILRPLQSAVFDVKLNLTKTACSMIQVLCRAYPEVYENYARIAGYDVVDVLANMERLGFEYGMYLEARPSGEEVQNLIESANAALSVGRDGASQIDLGQLMYLHERVKNGGNFKKLRRDIAFMIRKKEERDQAMALERERVNGEISAKAAQVSAQAKQQEISMKSQADISLEDKKTQNQAYLNKQQQELEIEKYMYEKQIDQTAGTTEKPKQ